MSQWCLKVILESMFLIYWKYAFIITRKKYQSYRIYHKSLCNNTRKSTNFLQSVISAITNFIPNIKSHAILIYFLKTISLLNKRYIYYILWLYRQFFWLFKSHADFFKILLFYQRIQPGNNYRVRSVVFATVQFFWVNICR